MKKKKINSAPYLNLQQTLIKLRALFSSPDINTNKLDAILGDLRFTRKQIAKHAKRRPKKILVYAIDTLFEMIEEGNREKIRDFADLIHNMPEIALKKRNFRSFAREISAFNNKYEEFCFGDINTIHIQISKETVKKILKASKVNFWAMFIGGIAAFILPWIFYAIYILGRLTNGRDDSGFSIFGFLATLTVSIGLANIFFSLAFQYHGRKFSIITLSVGGFALALSSYMIKNPHLYNPNISTFYCVSLIMMIIIPPLFYPFFRLSVETWINRKRRISKSKYRNLLKGKKNYWWFEALHKEANLGFIYRLNKAFTILFALTFTLTLLTGLKKEMVLLLCPMHILFYTILAIMTIFHCIQENLNVHGTPIVIFSKRSNRVDGCILSDILMVAISASPAYLIIILTQNIFT